MRGQRSNDGLRFRRDRGLGAHSSLPSLHDFRPTSSGSRATSDGRSDAGRIMPVSYMLPAVQARKSPKISAHRSLLSVPVSPLPHSPGYPVRHRTNNPAANRIDNSPRYPGKNRAGCLNGCPASCRASYLPENLVNYLTGDSAGYRTDCADSPRVRYSESNPSGNGADNLSDNLESYRADYPESYSGSLDSWTVCCTTGRPHLRGRPTRSAPFVYLFKTTLRLILFAPAVGAAG
jgi:hypothetical protein